MTTAALEAPPRKLTIAEPLLDSGDRTYELVDGQLVEKIMGTQAMIAAAKLNHYMWDYLEEHPIGYAVSENGFVLFPKNENQLRKPDVAFIRAESLPNGDNTQGFVQGAPDLAVEVVSPNDESEITELKVQEYLRAGVQLIWIVYPVARTARIIRANGTTDQIYESGELSGENVLPGFRCPLKKLLSKAK